jgi:hypothetical protein
MKGNKKKSNLSIAEIWTSLFQVKSNSLPFRMEENRKRLIKEFKGLSESEPIKFWDIYDLITTKITVLGTENVKSVESLWTAEMHQDERAVLLSGILLKWANEVAGLYVLYADKMRTLIGENETIAF